MTDQRSDEPASSPPRHGGRPFRLVVHAGMHKTGSSSIQKVLAGTRSGAVSYLDWRATNHSGLLALLCMEAPHEHKAFARLRRSAAHVAELRDTWLGRVRRQLRDESQDCVVFSGELMSSAETDEVRRFGDLVAESGRHVEVFAYVRPPRGFMESALQQRVRAGGFTDWDPFSLWPKYRQGIGTLDRVFGAENVHVRAFHPWEFADRDVVRDFLDWTCLPLEHEKPVRENEKISAEAAAVLYFQRKFGDGFGAFGEDAPKRNKMWIRGLQDLGSRTLSFSDSLFGTILEANRDDLDWMEARLGRRLEDRRAPGTFEIAGEEDLLALAMEQLPKVEALLKARIDGLTGPDTQKLVRVMEALRGLS